MWVWDPRYASSGSTHSHMYQSKSTVKHWNLLQQSTKSQLLKKLWNNTVVVDHVLIRKRRSTNARICLMKKELRFDKWGLNYDNFFAIREQAWGDTVNRKLKHHWCLENDEKLVKLTIQQGIQNLNYLFFSVNITECDILMVFFYNKIIHCSSVLRYVQHLNHNTGDGKAYHITVK